MGKAKKPRKSDLKPIPHKWGKVTVPIYAPPENRLLSSLDEIQAFARNLHSQWRDEQPRFPLVFRGMGDAKWPLETALERAFNKWGTPGPLRNRAERFLLKEFYRRAHQYISNPPADTPQMDTLEWLSLMQHHSAPTRLLDWSYSLVYAIFMALNALVHSTSKGCPDAAIWIIDPTSCGAISDGIIGHHKPYPLFEHDADDLAGSSQSRIEDFERYIWKQNRKVVYPVNALRLNERISVQQGLFLCPGDIQISFQENLANLADKGRNDFRLGRCVLKTSDLGTRRKLSKDIQKMGITQAQVFPGLEGFAKSMESRLVRTELFSE